MVNMFYKNEYQWQQWPAKTCKREKRYKGVLETYYIECRCTKCIINKNNPTLKYILGVKEKIRSLGEWKVCIIGIGMLSISIFIVGRKQPLLNRSFWKQGDHSMAFVFKTQDSKVFIWPLSHNYCMVGIPADQNSPKWRSTGNIWNLAYWISDSLLYWDIISYTFIMHV